MTVRDDLRDQLERDYRALTPASEELYARAQVVIGQERFRGATYVYVHTGRDLQPFLRTRNGGGIVL